MKGNYAQSSAEGSKIVNIGYPRGLYGRLALSIRDLDTQREIVAFIDPSQMPRIIGYLQQAWAEHNRRVKEPPPAGE